jgi:hypothetical protein
MGHIYAIVVTDEEELGFDSFAERVNERITTGGVGVNWLSNPLIPIDESDDFHAIVLEHGDALDSLDAEDKPRPAGENLRAAVQDADSVLRSLRGRVDGTGLIAGLDDALDRWDAWAAPFKDTDDIELEVGGMPHAGEERPSVPHEPGVKPAKFAVGDRIRSRVDGGVITDVGWSVTRGEWSYTINEPDSGRRAVSVYERSDEVRLA